MIKFDPILNIGMAVPDNLGHEMEINSNTVIQLSNILMYQMLQSVQQNGAAFTDTILKLETEAKVQKNENDALGKAVDLEV